MSERPKVCNINLSGLPGPNDVYIGRGTPWGNPFIIGKDGTRSQVIERFRCEVLSTLDVTPLIGKNLYCHCKPLDCHGDLLLEAAENLATWLGKS